MSNTKKVVLIVEDERPLLKAIGAKLTQAGFDIVTATTANQGLNMLSDVEHIDAIWLDHYLPEGKSGLEFLTEMKQSDAWKHIPVFVVTNTASSENKFSYLQLGVDKYFVKADMRLDEIVKEIQSFLDKSEE
jgi:DNA-binding response OmpR family regulator